jgi:hypothetical protein
MKVSSELRTVEPLEMVKKHPGAATLGGVVTGLLFGAMAAVVSGGLGGAAMAIIGIVIGAAGAAHVADAVDESHRPV